MNDLLTKYKSTSLKDFVGNRVVIKKLLDIVKEHPCGVLLIGPSGSGKTTLCNMVLNECQYDVLRISGGETEDLKSLKRLIDNFANNKTIESFFSKKKKLIFLDDVDILLTCDRNANSFLITFVETIVKTGQLSFIMSSSTSEEKKLTELKRKASCIRISNPSSQDVYLYISGILEKENMVFDDAKLLKLIEVHNNNIRNVLNNLHQMNLDDEGLKIEKQSKFMFDSNVFDIMSKLFRTRLSCKEYRMISENNLVPLLMYENYLNELSKNKVKQAKNIYFDIITSVIDSFIWADEIEHYMYKNTEWSLYDLVSITRCGYINLHMTSIPYKKARSFDSYVFTQILTKSALRCNYNKRLVMLKNNSYLCETTYILGLFDCIAKDYVNNVEHSNDIKALIKRHFRFDDEDMATMYQYFSQFLEIDKTVLTKIKKKLAK